jgi:hypothetical protein
MQTGASIRDHSSKTQTMLRLFVLLFGVLLLLCVIALGRQLVREHLSAKNRSKTLRASPEGWFLLVAAVAVSLRYLSGLDNTPTMPSLEIGWVWGYAICSSVYLAVKSARMLLMHT